MLYIYLPPQTQDLFCLALLGKARHIGSSIDLVWFRKRAARAADNSHVWLVYSYTEFPTLENQSELISDKFQLHPNLQLQNVSRVL